MSKQLIFMLLAFFMIGCGSDSEDTTPASGGESVTDQGGGNTPTAGATGGETNTDETEGGTENTTGDTNQDGDCGTVHTVTTTDDTSDFELYMDFTPADLTIAVGDCVTFELSNTHNAIEVSEETYNSRMTNALDNGFEVNYGETKQIKFDAAGVHYYICQPHVRGDMIGTITVQ